MSNREIDALCAEKVMGWKRKAFDWWESAGDGVPRLLPDLSTDPAASKQLRGKMRVDGWKYRIGWNGKDGGTPQAEKETQ